MITITEILENLNSAVSHERVFGPPTRHGDMTIIPASIVTAGGGGGTGHRPHDDAEAEDGTGAGFGVSARPAGVVIITAGNVRWKPTVDINRAIVGSQAVGIAYFVATWLIERSKTKASIEIARAAAGLVRD